MKKPKIKASDINHIAKIFRFSKAPVKSIIALFLIGFGAGVAWEEVVGIGTWHSYHPKLDKMNICFTPPAGCASLIATEIAKAKSSIYVQAYGFTSTPIIYQLKSAKNRGVEVSIILDGGNLSDNKEIASELVKSGIEVSIDKLSRGIAHNKVIIIDKKKVITGSFNFTNAADTKNAENTLLIDDTNIADIYLKNWQNRKKKAVNEGL